MVSEFDTIIHPAIFILCCRAQMTGIQWKTTLTCLLFEARASGSIERINSPSHCAFWRHNRNSTLASNSLDRGCLSVEWSYFDVDENIAEVSGPNPINSMLHALRCIMNVAIIAGVMAFTLLVAGCGKKNDLPGSNSITPKAPANAASIPVAQPALIAWKQCDKAAAVNKFVEADWSARPLFVAGSVLNLGEDQFKAFSDAERKARVVEMTVQLDVLKQLAKAVAQAGRDEALKGDLPQARMYFASLKQCGTALGSPDRLELVQMVGQSFRNFSDKETANIGK